MKKILTPILIFAIISLLIAAVLVLGKKSPVPTTSNPTANWKTYTNSQYNFSIKYPLDYSYTDTGPNYVVLNAQKGIEPSGTQPPVLDRIVFKNLNNTFWLSIFPQMNSNQKFNSNVNNLYEYSGDCGTQFANKTILKNISQLNNIPYKEVQQVGPNSTTTSITTTYLCFFTSQNNLLNLTSDTSSDHLLKQILSTFKFTN